MARARVVAGSRDHNGTLRDAPAVMEGTSTPVARRPGTRHAKHEPRSGGRCGARYRDVARGALRALGSAVLPELRDGGDRKSTRLNSSHGYISYAVFCLKKKRK